MLTPGNVHDRRVARAGIEALPPSVELVADQGYDSQALRDGLDQRGTQALIPPRCNRKLQYDYDRAIYQQRNVIELWAQPGAGLHCVNLSCPGSSVDRAIAS